MSFLILIISFLPIIIATKDPITGACISQHAGETGYFSNGVSATMMEPTGDPNTPYACDYLRFGATWWDEIEGIVQFTLFNQYRSQIAMWSDLSTTFGDQAQAGFQLTMSNHRLRPSSPYSAETLILASDNLQWMNDTLNTYLTLDIELSSPYTDQQLIVMSPACPLPSWVKSEPRFATILCVSLLPTPRSNVTAVGEQFLATLKSLNIDPFNTTSSYILSNTSIISPFETTVYLKHTITIPDPTLPGGLNSFQANEVVSSATHHQNQPITFEYVYEPGQMIILGPIDRYGCRQLMRRVWIYDLNFTVVGYGSSDRGICGAPRGIGLPTEQSVVIGQTASWHVDPIATAISNDVRMGLWQSARDLIAATPFGVQLTNIILISYNDRGDPIQAAINAQRLIQHDYVLAIVGATGVDTTQAILNKTKTLGPGLIWPSPVFSNRPIPITNLSRNSTYPIHPIYTDAPEVTTQAHGTFNTLDILLGVKSTNLPTPLICPQAGTRSFFKPYDPSVINIRVSYDDELAQLVSNILSSGSADIAVVYQNNTFGQQSYQSLQLLLALKGRSISRSTMIRVSPYSIYNQTNAARTISTISRGIGGGRPSYVVILADAPYVAQVIMAGRMAWLDSDTRYSPVIYAVTSYTHGAYLQQLLVSAGSPAFIQSQPSLPSSSQSVAAATFPKYGWYYDEAYLCGYLIHQSIVRASDIGLYTRDSVMATIKSDLPYIPRTGYTLGPFVNCSTGGHHTTIVRFREPGNREYIGSYPIQECGVNVFAPGPDALIFGQTAALTGSIADVGTSMRDGLLVAFREINDQGGINGRVLSLVTLDDGYNETRALNNAKTLVETYNVIGILGSVGTPTADAMIPYLTSRNIPLLFPYSGGRSLRVPYSRMILNLRASYDDEFTAFIRYAIGIGKEVFSLMFVNDPDGATARLSFQTSLWNQGLALISEGYYIHDTMNISDGLKNITSNPVQPQVIVCIGTTAPIALFISEARKYYPTALFYSISFIGAESLATALANYNITQNVIMTQVMPILSTGASDLLQDRYAKAMFNYCAACTLSSGSLEGYIAAQVLIQTFQRLGPISMSSLTSYIRESDNILFSNITTEQLRIVPPVTSASISTSLSSTILTSLDTDATSASSLSLRNPTILSILRDWFLTTVYNSGIFAINEFRIGPFTPNACEGKNLDCLQSKSQACNQGSHLVFISRLKSINNTNIFIEDVKWRYQTSSDECTINAYMIPADQTPIVFSQSGPLTGFNAQLGLEIRQGIRAAFANINAANGINGRKLILQTFDDNFSPERQAANLRMVIQLNKTLAILGSGPTANIQAILPTVTDAGIPLVGSIGGARDWRFPFNPYLIQLRATYDDECAAMLQWLKLNNKTRIVGVFADDAGGRSIADALQLALSYNKLSMHAFSAYNVAAANIADTFLTIEYQMGWRTQSEYDALLQRSTVFAPNSYAQQMIYDYAPNHGAARTSRAAPPDVFITGGSYQGILSLLTYSQNAANQATYKDAWYVSTLFTGIEKFRASISSSILQHVPVYMTSSFIQPEPPTSTTDSGIGHALSNYYKGMETLDPEYDPPLYTQVTLEGYIIGRIVVDHLQEAKTITSIGLMNAIYNNGIGDTYAGFQVGPYGKGCNAGIRNIRMEQLTYENTTHVPVVYNFTAGSTSECGIYQKYIDPPCSLGYRKIYTSADTLESICVACPAGRYGPDGLKCLICPAGSYSAGTAANCTLCPQGYFQDRAGQFQCEACPIGSWSSSINATKCISCEPGAITFTSASTNKSSCTCAPGFYSQRTMGILPSRDQDPDALLCRACTNSDWINSGCLLNDAGPGPGIRSTILALTVISMVATAVVAILTYKFRRAPVVKAASPPILLMMLAGAELGYITNIIALPYPQTTNTCMIQPYFAYVGFALLFGGLFAKTYRVGRIFNQKHIVKIKITNADLTKVVRVLIIIFLILIILWHIMDPAKPMITDNGNEEFTWCTQDQHVWAIAPLVFAYIVLIYGVYLCYKNRNITSFFNETKHISIILYNTMFVGTVFVAAYMLIVTTEQQATLVMSLGVLVVINVAVGVLFIPKLKTVWKGMTDVNSNNSQLGESGSSHHSGHDSGHFNLSGSGDGSIQLSQLMASHAHLQKKVKMMMTTEAKMKALITSLEDQVAHYYPKYEKGVRLQRIMQQQAAAAATSSQRRHSADQPRSQLSTGEKTGARVSSVGDKDIGLKSSTISPTVVSRSSQVPNTTKQPLMGPDRYRSSSISNGTGTDTGAARSPSLEMVVSIRDSPARGNTSVLPERERASPPTSNRLFMSPDDLAPRPIRRSVAESSGVSRSNSIDQKEKEPDSTSQHESSSHQPFKLSPSPNQPARRRLSIGTTPAKGTGTPKVAPMNATAAGTTPSTSTSPSTSPQVHPSTLTDVPSLT